MNHDKYKSPTQFLESVRKYLRENRTEKNSQGELENLKNHLAFDRFITRIAFVEETRWAVKGGFLMNLRFNKSRTTNDIDMNLILPPNTEMDNVKLRKLLSHDLNQQVDDHFKFVVGEGISTQCTDGAPGGGARMPIEVYIGKNLFTSFHVDIGIMDVPYEMERFNSKPDFVDFFELTQKLFPVVSLEQQMAEKIHAYTMPRGNKTNTRFKDLVDIVIMIQSGELDNDKVKEAITWVFDVRKTHEIPDTLPEPPKAWHGCYEKLAAQCDISDNLDASFELMEDYFDEIDMIEKEREMGFM